MRFLLFCFLFVMCGNSENKIVGSNNESSTSVEKSSQSSQSSDSSAFMCGNVGNNDSVIFAESDTITLETCGEYIYIDYDSSKIYSGQVEFYVDKPNETGFNVTSIFLKSSKNLENEKLLATISVKDSSGFLDTNYIMSCHLVNAFKNNKKGEIYEITLDSTLFDETNSIKQEDYSFLRALFSPNAKYYLDFSYFINLKFENKFEFEICDLSLFKNIKYKYK